ncbi:MAG: SURF1 family protein [Gammaproteobacteria bacterium]
MKKIRFGPVVIHIALFPAVAFVCLLPLLLALGAWQLERAEEKRQWLDMQQQRMLDSPLRLSVENDYDPESLRYRLANAEGEYDAAHQFLIDNQVINGRVGYYVLTPYKIRHSDRAVLINRGWIPAGNDRRIVPKVPIVEGRQTVRGRINLFPAVGIKLAGAEVPSEGWPAVVQLVDSRILSKRLGYRLYDFQLELDPRESDGYIREWKTEVAITPEKHRAYAFQWFGLALTLVIIFVWVSCKLKTDE